MPPAADVDCTVVLEAGEKTLDTPHHLYTLQADANHAIPLTRELITINNFRYLLVGRKWTNSPISLDAARNQAREHRKNPRMFSRHYLRDKMVGTEPAGVYTVRTNREGDITNVTLWISKTRHLYLKQESGAEGAPEDETKSHNSGPYEYTNVQAPQYGLNPFRRPICRGQNQRVKPSEYP